jgi:hypothetical protein
MPDQQSRKIAEVIREIAERAQKYREQNRELPMQSIETTFAPDSSGFCTSRFIRWFDIKYVPYIGQDSLGSGKSPEGPT